MKRIFQLAISIPAFVGLLAVPTSARAEKISMAMDWILNGKHSPFFMGIDKGFYKKAGIEVSINRGFGSSTTVKDVAAGSTDYGFADSGSVIIGKGRGAKVKLLAVIHDKLPHVIYSLSKSRITKPADLKGKKIGAPVGDAIRTIFPAFARANKLDPDKDIIWVTITPAAKPPSLLSGNVDAITNYVTDGPPLFDKAAKLGKKINAIAFPDWGVDIYSNGFATQDTRIKNNPDQVRRVVAAMIKAWAWSVENPSETIKLYRKYVPAISPDLARRQLDIAIDLLMTENAKKHGIGFIVKEKMEKTLNIIAKYMGDKLKSRPRAEDLYTNEFLPKLFPKRGI
ncbi:MAG: ABC transporter substrate-binding protein [Nitrospinota bacterium]